MERIKTKERLYWRLHSLLIDRWHSALSHTIFKDKLNKTELRIAARRVCILWPLQAPAYWIHRSSFYFIPWKQWKDVLPNALCRAQAEEENKTLNALIWSLEQEKGRRKRRASQLPAWFQHCNPMTLNCIFNELVSQAKRRGEEGWENSGHRANSFPAQTQSLEDTGLPPVMWSHSPGGRVSFEGSWWEVQSVHWGILLTGHVSQEPEEKERQRSVI